MNNPLIAHKNVNAYNELNRNKEEKIMFEWVRKRKERKQEIEKIVQEDKVAEKKRKKEISQMAEAEKKEAKLKDKKQKKEEKLASKKELNTLDKKARKERKKELKMYKKIKARPRRAVMWTAIVGVIAFIGVQIGPTIGDIYQTMTAQGIELTTGTAESQTALEAGEILSEEIVDEGIILLKNEEENLPLQNKKVNVFGTSAYGFRYSGGGSGGADTSRALSLFDGLNEAGIEFNAELNEMYKEMDEVESISGESSTGLMAVVGSMISPTDMDEPAVDYLTDDILKQAKDYSDEALITITSAGVESSDMSLEDLQLTENKKELIRKVSEYFENITVVINAGNTLELGFLEEVPQVKSIVWVGTPGPYGTRSLGNVLAGNINPSGRTTDTYAYDVSSAPATENFGDYQYENLDKAFVNYQEGIYIGYRFYETYYQNDEEGYQQAVQFPYGYGLSYTDFDWEVVDQNFNEDTIQLDVEVTNTGDMAGKEVVQLYFSAPYTDGEIEKSAIELGAYAKTEEIQPGETAIVQLSFATNDMASYDMMSEEAYVLDEGNYQIKLARNVHDIVETFDYQNENRVVINQDDATGTEMTNLFPNADTGFDYLSREDWEATYPSDENLDYNAPQFVLDEVNKETTASDIEMPLVAQDNDIQLQELKDLSYDDPKWQDFLAQFTVEEMMDFVTEGAYRTIAIERLGVPASVLLDGPAGINFFFQEVEAAAYPTAIVLASTWNDDLAYALGESVGKEAKAIGMHGWYAPAMNIHRTAQGGRNFEYYSEDPLLSGKMAAAVSRGSQDQGVMVFMKHFALNDQETNARSGLYVWANEQAMREIHLKPFEITVKEGETLGVMSSFSYINGQWAGGNSILLNDLLRDEWGFEGVVSSDAVFGFMHANDAVVSGNDLMLDIMSNSTNKNRLEEAYEIDPAGITQGLQTSLHNTLYALLQTHLFE